jgi:hypothetical protein
MPDGTAENNEMPVKIADVPAGIRIENLLNTGLEPYFRIHIFGRQ